MIIKYLLLVYFTNDYMYSHKQKENTSIYFNLQNMVTWKQIQYLLSLLKLGRKFSFCTPSICISRFFNVNASKFMFFFFPFRRLLIKHWIIKYYSLFSKTKWGNISKFSSFFEKPRLGMGLENTSAAISLLFQYSK